MVPEFDVEAFIAKLAGMGMKLTAVPLADGTLKIYRWRMTVPSSIRNKSRPFGLGNWQRPGATSITVAFLLEVRALSDCLVSSTPE